MVDDLELIEKRIAHLESLVGKFDKIDNTKVCCWLNHLKINDKQKNILLINIKGFETLLDVSNKLTSFINSNSKIAAAFKLCNHKLIYIKYG